MNNLSSIRTRSSNGIEAPEVVVEIHLSNGLPNFSIVGLPETAVKESKDRVRSALLNSGFEFFRKRITVSLAPANLPKSGGRYDLPIALGILVASGQIQPAVNLDDFEFYGELSLTGELRQTDGLLPALIQANQHNKIIVIPSANADLSIYLEGANVFIANSLLEVVALLVGKKEIEKIEKITTKTLEYTKDFNQVKGQYQAKRAMEIAAAGGHNLLLIGVPGSGKTMLSERIPSILPPLSKQQALEKASVFSIANQYLDPESWQQRSFIAPHHSASAVSLVGGGANPKPGAISLAHHGVLFLDELPEFPRNVLETLRQPLETKEVYLSRAANQVKYPANFQLIAAMNPCPCGYLGEKSGRCNCSEEQISRYRSKISGPLLDRIDMLLEVQALPKEKLLGNDEKVESSEVIRQRVLQAVNRQNIRQGKYNQALSSDEIEKMIILCDTDKQLLETAIDKLKLSARAYFKILRLARTIADLSNNENILKTHLVEAISYRRAL
ncbi:MG(2+) CHELATASE FAMILY PROTEIN / ComM-related protein [hydrothermal vent metagenome]|uniref:MG(2+) CHELATASE FAMILY PROTEIN / ComM-related protein n=1 Tax=hydrothermal vent metagenome TaxID=652676 RepID=A0A1W1CI68_9ZZZZ